MTRYLLLILIGLVFFSCRKDKDIDTTVGNEYPTELYINCSLKGKIVGNRDIPIENAVVTIGEYTQKSDLNGYFYFENIKANKSGATIEVTKEGHSSATKIFYPELNTISYIKIYLDERNKITIINTTDESKSFGSEYASINITKNGFLKEGKKFNGQIKPEPYWNIYSDLDLDKKQIADPIAFNKYFKLKGLNSFGVLGINLIDLENQTIEIDSENIIELKLIFDDNLPLPSNTPEKIPLWHFSSEKGKWLQNGEAMFRTENGISFYYADVNKTGYWNFATFFDIEEAELSFQSENKSILPYTKVEINSSENNYNLSLNTNSSGNIFCYLPKNEEIEMKVFLKNKIIDKRISSDSKDIELNSISKTSNISGQFLNCMDETINNGYITIMTGKDTMFYHLKSDGSFEENIILEDIEEDISWFTTDLNSKTNTLIHNTYIDENNNVVIGNAFVCEEPFAIMRLGNERYLMNAVDIDFSPPFLTLVFEYENAKLELSHYPLHGIGEYNINNIPPTIYDNNGNVLFIYQDLDPKLEIIEYNAPGMVRGTLKGFVRTNFAGTDTTSIKIDYSVFIE